MKKLLAILSVLTLISCGGESAKRQQMKRKLEMERLARKTDKHIHNIDSLFKVIDGKN